MTCRFYLQHSLSYNNFRLCFFFRLEDHKKYRQIDREQINKLNQQLTDYESEISMLRRTVDNLETDRNRDRARVQDLQNEVDKLRIVSRLHRVIFEQIVLMYRGAYDNNRTGLFPLNTTQTRVISLAHNLIHRYAEPRYRVFSGRLCHFKVLQW